MAPGRARYILLRMAPATQRSARGTDGDILLVSCYELGHEPLGILVPAGVLARAGWPARLLDLAVQPVDEAAIARARLVAISTPMHTALRLGARVAGHVRRVNPGAHIAFFGLYAGLNAHHLTPDLADSCLGAEFEADLVDLVGRIAGAPERPPREVSAPRPDGGRRSPGREMDLAPLRDAIVHRDHYARLAIADERRDTGYVQATRGCRHNCTHCPLPPAYGGRFYAIPPDRVLADIAAVVEGGARHITFADPDFLNGPGHALRIARALHERFPAVTFDCTAKIEHLKQQARTVEELRDLGCIFVVSAVESMNDDVLSHLRKGHTRDDALDVIRAFRRLGLTLRPSLVPFTPWETRSSLRDLIDIVEGEGLVECLDAVQYSIRLLLPEGSLLLEDASMRACMGPFDRAAFGYRWCHPDPAMDAMQAELARVVEGAVEEGLTPVEAFERVRGVVAPERSARVVPAAAGPAPRLTEDWFC